MTEEQIQQLLNQKYNQVSWKQFLGETFSKSQLLATPETLTGIDSNVASNALKLGYILLDENGIERQIAVYEVVLSKGIILERNRVGLRNLLREYWKNIDAAFIVYHSPETPKWRFTYVSELTGYDAEGEFIKIKTEPKRYTYVLGEGESTRTAAERFALISEKAYKATLEDVKDAFSVEKLSRSFFAEYKKHYDLFCEFMMNKPGIQASIFNGNEKSIRDFNKKLLGRIVFLYFIQKKGWLGVPLGSKWGEGDFNFLTNLFKQQKNSELFYSEILTRLFFDTLNIKRKDDIIELVTGQPCRIPYLNGGLFEEDNKKYRNIIFDGTLFENLFNFFNQYNFTIYEDDPNDHTVAVDPEMLGHIFENLLEDNKDKGAFYTPKEIVHYMCQESLLEYLKTFLDESGKWPREEAEKKALEESLSNFIKKKEGAGVIDYDRELAIALRDVKICDPAIGSGAFPMGLLNEIFHAVYILFQASPDVVGEQWGMEEWKPNVVKKNIIQNSIYGVDIEKGAVDIARLRFWLSLIIDEPEPKALPNLDYKIVVGNSLASKLGDDIIDIDWNLNDTSHGFFGADLAKQKIELLKKISFKQKEFFNPGSNKNQLSAEIRKLKIDLLINQLELMVRTSQQEIEPKSHAYKSKSKFLAATELFQKTLGWKESIKQLKQLKDIPEKALDFFDWKLDFPEVLNDLMNPNPGFDILIGNPPYGANIDDLVSYFKVKFPETTKEFRDIYKIFYNQGIEYLLKINGILSYITPNTFLFQPRYKDLRHFFLKYQIKSILEPVVGFQR